MSAFTEKYQFFKEFLSNIQEVAAVLPTSVMAANALAAEVAQWPGPKRVLEVGAGTGAITAQLVHHLTPNDELTLCELNATFMATLQKRFAEEASLRRVQSQTHFFAGSILDLPAEGQYDFIISTLPFNVFPVALVEEILAYYQRLLKPGGVLSYIEYIGGRTLHDLIGHDPHHAARLAVMQRYQAQYAVGRAVVLRNVPPAWIHYLRFQPAAVETALTLAPRAPTDRLTVGAFAVDSAALPFLGVAIAIAWWLRKSAPQSRLWWWAAAVAPLLAAFFRDPARPTVTNPTIAYAASDGVVLAVEELTDPRFGEEKWLRIVVFLSLLDVHLNYAPVAGRVLEVVEETGGFAAASLPAAEHNNALYTVIEGVHGRCIVAQRVGLIARRIVNRLRPGGLVTQGAKMGLIRFGSRTDVYLPAAQWEALVKKGERVQGGLTPLARLLR